MHDTIMTRSSLLRLSSRCAPNRSPWFRRLAIEGTLAPMIALALAFPVVDPARAQRDRSVTFDMLDADGDGALSRMEVRRTPLAARHTLLDTNGDGMLSRRELMIRARSPDGPLSPDYRLSLEWSARRVSASLAPTRVR